MTKKVYSFLKISEAIDLDPGFSWFFNPGHGGY